jgi:hypothetical protein
MLRIYIDNPVNSLKLFNESTTTSTDLKKITNKKFDYFPIDFIKRPGNIKLK